MSTGTQEIEQGFIPTAETVAAIKAEPTRVLDIIQAYLQPDSTYFKRDIRFDAEGSKATITFSVAGNEIASISETDAEKIAALAKANAESNGAFLQNARIRRQADRHTGEAAYLLTIKGPKVAGAGTEFEFEIANKAGALDLMTDYGKDKLVYKTRTVQEGVDIAGKARTLELDEFHGRNEGKIKLEIEHASKADMLPEAAWRTFAAEEVTENPEWRNFNLAGADDVALSLLNSAAETLRRTAVATAKRDGTSTRR